jgi:tRNA pseudouridine65 synthase
LSHPNDERPCKNALLQLPYDFEQEAYRFEGKLIYLLHRLDAPTSGVILASTDLPIAQHVKQLFKQHLVKKTYLAIVKGFPPTKALWRDPIDIRNRQQTVRAKEGSGSGPQKIAQTEIVTLQRLPSTSQPFFLVQLHPLTGFSHQLRFQCAKHHLPILGDQTYGDFKLNRWLKKQFSINNLCLHAHKIQLPLPFSATSPLPEYFGLLIK